MEAQIKAEALFLQLMADITIVGETQDLLDD